MNNYKALDEAVEAGRQIEIQLTPDTRIAIVSTNKETVRHIVDAVQPAEDIPSDAVELMFYQMGCMLDAAEEEYHDEVMAFLDRQKEFYSKPFEERYSSYGD